MNPRILFFALISFTLLSGCGNGDDENEPTVTLNSNAVSLAAGETFQLKLSTGKALAGCTSKNQFVATVTPQGLITAILKGTCNIKADGRNCTVTVTTAVNNFEEPLMQWNISSATLVSMKGSPARTSPNGSNTNYIYDGTGKVASVAYVFNGQDRLIRSMLAIDASHDALIDAFLNERYMNVSSMNTEYYNYYVNASTPSSTTLLVRRYLQSIPYRTVSFEPYN